MKHMSHVSSWLILTLLLGASPGWGSDHTDAPDFSSSNSEAVRPAGLENVLINKKYHLLTDVVFTGDFTKLKVTSLTADGTEMDEQTEVLVSAEKLSEITKFIEMSKNLRDKLQTCASETGSDKSSDAFANVMDAFVRTLVRDLTTPAGNDKKTRELKTEEGRALSEKDFATYLWALEAYFKAQKGKHFKSDSNQWNEAYVKQAKAAFKALLGSDFAIEKWQMWKREFDKKKSVDRPRLLKDMIEITDTAKTELAKESKACLVKPNAAQPAVPTTPAPSPATPSPTPSPKVDIGTGAPLPTKPGPGTDTSKGDSPTNTDRQNPPPQGNPQQPNPNIGDGLFREFGNDANRVAQQEADALRQQLANLQNLFDDLKRNFQDRVDLLNDDNRNNDAIRDALGALGQGNQNQPVVPPPIIPPQFPQADNSRRDEGPQLTPPPDDVAQPQPFNPASLMGPPQPPPPQIIVQKPDNKDSNPFADLAAKSQPQQLPMVSDTQATMSAMRDMMQLQMEQLRARSAGMGRAFGQGVNNLMGRLKGLASSRRNRAPNNGLAKGGSLGRANQNGRPTSPKPSSLKMGGRI